jgi:hypothetical protein
MRPILLMALIFCSVITSCSIIGDGSARLPEVLSTNPCEPPCWYGIIPGETTHEEVLSLLPDLPFIKPETIQDWYDETGVHIKSYTGASGVRFHYDEGKFVKVIIINPSARIFSFGDVISAIGEPDKVLAVQGPDSREGVRYKLIYAKSGIVFGGVLRPFDARKEQALIKENHQVTSIYFFNPDLIEQVFTDFSISGLSEEVFRSGLQDWQGFGEIDPVEEFPNR